MAIIDWTLEAVKLIAQLGGAAGIGWIGVRWALARYKSEKTWERRLAAYTDIVSALTEMQRVLSEWQKYEETNTDPGESNKARLREEYRLAERNALAVKGLAELLLPEKVASVLKSLPVDLDNASYRAGTWYESVDNRWGVVEDAKEQIVSLAKIELGIR